MADDNKSRASAFAKMIGGTYGGGIIFPVLRKGKNTKEKNLIQKANIAFTFFWGLFLSAMLLVLLN